MIWAHKLTVTFAIFIQDAMIYFSKKFCKEKKFNRNVFIFILQILSNMPKNAISWIYSPFICTATTDSLYLHNSPLLLSRTRALELHFSGSLWLCVVVSLKRLSSRSHPVNRGSQRSNRWHHSTRLQTLRSALLCSAGLRCCSWALSQAGMWTALIN